VPGSSRLAFGVFRQRLYGLMEVTDEEDDMPARPIIRFAISGHTHHMSVITHTMSDNPLQSIFSSRTLVRALSVFLLDPDRSFYQQELLRETGGPLRPLQLVLEKLAGADLITARRDGRQVYYRANALNPVFGDLKSLFEKSFAIGDVVRDALEPQRPMIRLAFIYGSVASGELRAASDIDLFVVGMASRKAIASCLGDAETMLRREINVSLYEPGRFADAVRLGDPFVLDVMSRPKTWLVGDEDGLGALAG
jgi:predicted nucleotidyltransferase